MDALVCVRQTAWPACSDSHQILHRFCVALQHLLFTKNVLNLKFVHRKELEREFSIVLSADIEPADFQLPAGGCLSPTLLSIYIYTYEMLYGRKAAEVQSTLLTPGRGGSAEQWMDRRRTLLTLAQLQKKQALFKYILCGPCWSHRETQELF